MGQFKPMVKMETTEPSVILKLAKGGHVNMKKDGKAKAGHKKMAMGGGAMEALMGTPALVGRPAVNAPVRAPGKPSMAMRRKAMMAKKPMMPPPVAPPMKKGGKADMPQDKAMIKKAFKQHDMQEHKGGKGTKLALKKGGKMATGGVVNGQGGFATGGVAKANGGGYKMGGMTKMADGGGLLDQIGYQPGGGPIGGFPGFPGGRGGGGGGGDASSGLETVNQGATTIGGALKNIASSVGSAGGGGGRKPPDFGPDMPIYQKRGGKVSKKAYATGGTVNSGRPVAMPQGSKKPSPPVSTNRVSGTFKSGGTVKMNGGGDSSDKGEDMTKGAYDKAPKYSRDLEDAFNPLGMVKELAGKAKDFFMPKTADSVTKTKESVTVTPAGKKRGGVAC